jgi:hypothetical protein
VIESKAKWKLHDYASARNLFKEWTQGLEPEQIAKLNMLLRRLEKEGPDDLLAGICPVVKGQIRKLKIKTRNSQLRPLLCKGPVEMESEITLLMGAQERDRKWVPWDAKDQAEKRRKAILERRAGRCPHEWVSGKPEA